MVDVKADASDMPALAETVVLDQADLDTTVLVSKSEEKVETTAKKMRNGVRSEENLAEENNGDLGGNEEENGHDLMAGGEGEDLITGEEGRDLIAEGGEEKDKYRDEDAKEENKNEGETGDKKDEEVERGDKMNEENAVNIVEGKGVEKEVADNGTSKENIGKNLDENSTVNVRHPMKRMRKKKVTQGAPDKLVSKDDDRPESLGKKKVSDKVVSKDEDKPESSGKKKISKKVESMGMIFMCTSETKKDCYRYKLLGLPAGKKDIVEKIYKGMRLFLFDLDLRLMYGIYKAAAPGGSNIEPKAFKSAFPSQVRFTVLEDCLPLAEEKFKVVIKDNYYSRNKFHCQLTSEQVRKLCKLFVSSSKGPALQKVGKSLVAGRHVSESQYKNKRLGQDVKRGLKKRDRDEDLGHKKRERVRIRPDRDEERGRKRRGRREERKSLLRQEQSTHEHRVIYTNDVFPSQVAPQHRGHQLPAPLHGYGRTLEMNLYRHEQVLENSNVRLFGLEPRHYNETKNLDSYLSYGERESPYRGPIYSSASE